MRLGCQCFWAEMQFTENRATLGQVKAIVQKGYGPPEEVLQLAEVEPPRPRKHQVLLRVHAAGVNPADFVVAQGKPYLVRLVSGLFRPRRAVGGSDVAGTVEAVDATVTRFRPGDEVFGAAEGSFAEFAVANEKDLVMKPANTSFEQAAATPMAGLVALQALSDKANLQPGQTVLITGAGGGIGSFAVQIARMMGAEVTGVSSTDKLDLVRSLGASRVIDYRHEDFTKSTEDLEALRSFLSIGEVTPVVGRTFPLDETPKALTLVGEGHALGKIVVTGVSVG